jgi:hypothetical protein
MEIIPLPIKTPDKLHSYLPSQHMLITAPTASGKTVLLINMIGRKKFPYLKYYEKIHVFSPTVEIDNSWNLLKNIKNSPYVLKEDMDIDYIYDLIARQEEDILLLGKNKAKHHLLVIDDHGGDMKSSKNRFMVSLLMRLRHSNIHLWLTTQSYRAIPRGMRLQFAYHIIFRVSPQELEIIANEVNGSLDSNVFKSMYLTAITDRPYNFLYIDISKQNLYSGFLNKLVYKKIEKLNTDNISKETIK